jgi:hypothetical protein
MEECPAGTDSGAHVHRRLGGAQEQAVATLETTELLGRAGAEPGEIADGWAAFVRSVQVARVLDGGAP